MKETMEGKNIVYCGLIDTMDQDKKPNVENKSIQFFCDNTVTVEYDHVTHRLMTEIDISPCNNRNQTLRVKNAVWDTGAVMSAISMESVEKMKLSPIDVGVVITSTGQSNCCYYLVDVYLTANNCIKAVKVMGLPFKNHDAEFLIGMDIISQGNLTISNENNKTCVKFDYLADN